MRQERACQGILDAVEIADGARKHAVADADINHALRHAVRTALQTNDETGEVRQLVVGPATDGRLLEIVVVRPYTTMRPRSTRCPLDRSSFEGMPPCP